MKALFTRYRLLFFHLIFWTVLISYRLFDFTQYLSIQQALIFFGIPTALNMCISYVHYFFILPYIYGQKKVRRYFVLLTFTLIAFLYLRFLSDHLFVVHLVPEQAYYKSIHLARVLSVLWGYLSFTVLTVMIKLAVDWYELENKRKQLENEKLSAELKYLKSQINPHFLFNTLHNLNYLALSKDATASDVIIRLSNMMRYMIYDTNKEEVLIKEEIQYMKDYIELEKIRLNQSFTLTFEVGENVGDCKIAPLLLFTCLENAFKHGVSDKQKSWVTVRLRREEETFHYWVSNSKIAQPSTNEPSGFGLHNLRKRLTLHYPMSHELQVEETDNQYSIHLKITGIV
ncbi:MAG: histidine kinase [Ekhidna sp.]